MKKLFTLFLLIAFTSAYAQQPTGVDVEAAKHAKLMDMLAQAGNNAVRGGTMAPEQDCMNAITVCQTVYSQANSYVGSGSIAQEIGQSCLGAGELNGAWYKVVAADQGFLGFNITPNDPIDDYDWAVFDLTYNSCSQIFNNPTLEVSCDFSGSTNPTGITGPNDGFNPQDEPMIAVIPGHTYYVYVSNFSSTQSGYTIDFGISTIPIGNCAFIYGNIYYDYNQNCQREGNDTGLPQQIVYATPGPFYAMTNANGFYALTVPQTLNQTYQINCINTIGELDMICPAVNYREVTITNIDSVYTGNDFAFFGNDNGNTPCPVIEVSNVAWGHRVCCPGNRYITVCNSGSGAYTGNLHLNYYDDFINPVSASMPYTTNGNTLIFDLPVIGIGQCVTITVTEEVADTAYVNEVACVEAVATPIPACAQPNNLWDGSDLIAIGECMVDTVRFTITNNGIGNMNQPEAYEVYREGLLIDNGTVQLQAGQSTVLSYAANGEFMVIQVNQSDYNPNVSNPSSYVANCGPEMPPSQAYNYFTQGDEATYEDVDCNTITNSYDPNDKAAVPQGLGVQHYIKSTDEIEYKIRFQNLGTANANKIVVVDSLDSFLEITSLEIGASSHHYTAQLSGNGVLTFTFEDIELPPASVDETNSVGVIQYRIKQRYDNPINYTINNKAYIYFDLNPAIITNNVFHNVKDNFATAMPETVGKDGFGVIAFPNPAANNITLRLNALKAGQSYSLAVYNSAGALVKELKGLKNLDTILDIASLSNGLYTYRIVTTEGHAVAGRFVKE